MANLNDSAKVESKGMTMEWDFFKEAFARAVMEGKLENIEGQLNQSRSALLRLEVQ